MAAPVYIPTNIQVTVLDEKCGMNVYLVMGLPVRSPGEYNFDFPPNFRASMPDSLRSLTTFSILNY